MSSVRGSDETGDPKSESHESRLEARAAGAHHVDHTQHPCHTQQGEMCGMLSLQPFQVLHRAVSSSAIVLDSRVFEPSI